MQKSEYWIYEPKFIPEYVFEPLLKMMKEYCRQGISSKRISCLFNDINNRGLNFDYAKLPAYKWSDAPSILHEICKLVEQYTNEKYDYVLVHIYPDGNSSINWHNDSEALNSSIASVSLGATRKFRLRSIGRTKGWNSEFKLENGDLFVMKGPERGSDNISKRLSCQQVYEHTIPVEKTVKSPRINLTFRQL